MRDAIHENMGRTIVYSDADVLILRPSADRLLELLGDADLACQQEPDGTMCSGFYISKCNSRTLRFFESIVADPHDVARHSQLADQAAFNHYCGGLDCVALPWREFWTVGWHTKTPWEGQEFEIPEAIRMMHANWCVGIEAKFRLLKSVRQAMMQ